MAKYLKINGNAMDQGTFLQSSTGAGDADKPISTDSSGRIDTSFMPVGIGADVKVANAAENLAANDLVNFSSSGTVRKADASNGRPAHGFVTASVTLGNPATVYKEGTITGMSGLTPGARYFLSVTAGLATATAPTVVGQLWQPVGDAVSTTELDFEREPAIVL